MSVRPPAAYGRTWSISQTVAGCHSRPWHTSRTGLRALGAGPLWRTGPCAPWRAASLRTEDQRRDVRVLSDAPGPRRRDRCAVEEPRAGRAGPTFSGAGPASARPAFVLHTGPLVRNGPPAALLASVGLAAPATGKCRPVDDEGGVPVPTALGQYGLECVGQAPRVVALVVGADRLGTEGSHRWVAATSAPVSTTMRSARRVLAKGEQPPHHTAFAWFPRLGKTL